MSEYEGHLVHPLNGERIEVWSGYSFPCLFLGCFWYGTKGLWGWAIMALFLAFFTFGIAWIFMAAFANGQHFDHLRKQGYLTKHDIDAREEDAAKASIGSVADEIEKFAALRDSETITEEEYERQKRRLLR